MPTTYPDITVPIYSNAGGGGGPAGGGLAGSRKRFIFWLTLSMACFVVILIASLQQTQLHFAKPSRTKVNGLVEEGRGGDGTSIRGDAKREFEEDSASRGESKRIRNGAPPSRESDETNAVQVEATVPGLPPVSDLMDEESLELRDGANLKFLLDFVVAGHAKCGTTFLLRGWLGEHNEIVLPDREVRTISRDRGVPLLVQKLYKEQSDHLLRLSKSSNATSASDGASSAAEIASDVHLIRGYKNPHELEKIRALNIYRDYFPQTKLVVGIRHPVLWFQSFYNYRMKRGTDLPHPSALVGNCNAVSELLMSLPDQKSYSGNILNLTEPVDVCTEGANFHRHLAQLGRTPLSTQRELELLALPSAKSTSSVSAIDLRVAVPEVPNPVFLYEVSQMDGTDETVSKAMRDDMSQYLGLRDPLPPLTVRHSAHGEDAFRICDDEHESLRNELMRISIAASTWIVEYFLSSPDVVVSSPDHIKSILLNEWTQDPCTAQ